MLKKAPVVREKRRKKEEVEVELNADATNFDQWFDQNLDDKYKSWKVLSAEDSAKLTQLAKHKKLVSNPTLAKNIDPKIS